MHHIARSSVPDNGLRALASGVAAPSRSLSKQMALYKVLIVSWTTIALVAAGITISILVQNRQSEQVTEEQIATASELNEEQKAANGGTDNETAEDARITSNGVVIPSIIEPSLEEIMSYTTAPDLPKRIEINGIGLLARVTTVDDNALGEIGVPANIFNASWYVKSSKLGQRPGASILVGHVGFRSIKGAFSNITALKPQDKITIVLGDNTVLNYTVQKTQNIPTAEFKTSDYLSYQNTNESFLHLITCIGDIAPGSNQYESRYIVTATLD